MGFSRFQRQHQLLREGLEVGNCQRPAAQRGLGMVDCDARSGCFTGLEGCGMRIESDEMDEYIIIYIYIYTYIYTYIYIYEYGM